MKYKVYHAHDIGSILNKVPESFCPDDYMLVAEVECLDDEDVFRATNHINSDWTLNPEVTHRPRPLDRCRSTSVGDVIINEDGVALYCAGCGWETLSMSTKA